MSDALAAGLALDSLGVVVLLLQEATPNTMRGATAAAMMTLRICFSYFDLTLKFS